MITDESLLRIILRTILQGLVFSMIIVRIGLGVVTLSGETRNVRSPATSSSRGAGLHTLGPFIAAAGTTTTTMSTEMPSMPHRATGVKAHFTPSIVTDPEVV